jgi:hypothetical protein
MAAKKRRGPRVTTYVLTVNEETGKVLGAHVEDPRTGARKKASVQASFRGVPTVVLFGDQQQPGDDSSLPAITGPVTRLALGALHINKVAPVNPAPTRLPKARLK